jgi:hypothetical protein
LQVLTAIGAVKGFFIPGRRTSLAMYPSGLFPKYVRATVLAVVLSTRLVVAGIAALASPRLIQTFGRANRAAVIVGSIYLLGFSVTRWIGPERRAKPLPGADGLAEPSSHCHVFAAE